MHAVEGSRRVHIAVKHQRAGTLEGEHLGLKQFVEHPYSARLYDNVRPPGAFESAAHALLALPPIDYYACPFRVRHVTVLLSLVCVRLVESDLVAPLAQRPD